MTPQLVLHADRRFAGDWSKWPVPTMPDLPVEPWADVPGCFWREDVSGWGVDAARTVRLEAFDVPVKSTAGNAPWQGSSYGMPFQIVSTDDPMTGVWDLSRWVTWAGWFQPVFPIVRVPLPTVVRREGDPGGGSDMHWYGFDPGEQVLWEAILLRDNGRWSSWFQCDWTAGYSGGGPGVVRWDCSRPWDAPGQPRGVVAADVPQFPMVARWDEIRAGRIGHALFGVLPNYAPERVGPARHSDGSMLGHPVRAGERLRLRREVVERFEAGSTARIVAEALWEFGWVQGDRNSGTDTPGVGHGGFPLTMDRRWQTGDDVAGPLGEFEVRLSDFEVLVA